MRARDQVIGAVVLAGATYFGLYRIAEAKNETAVGGGVFPLERSRPQDMAAYDALRAMLDKMGEAALAGRLERLRDDGDMWVAPRLGPERWAVFVESLRLVRRIYVRREALLDPVAHLYRAPRPDIPQAYRRAHAWISLAGALRHELAHRDGLIEEAPAYDVEIEWYEGLRRSAYLASLQGEERQAWEWGVDSAILSARKARDMAA